MKRILILLSVSLMLAGCMVFSKKQIDPVSKSTKYHKTVFFDSSIITNITQMDSSIDLATSSPVENCEPEELERENVCRIGRTMHASEKIVEGKTQKLHPNPASADKNPPMVSIVNNANEGRIAYKVPDTMTCFKNYDVIVRIDRDTNDTNILHGLIRPISNNIVTSSTMEVNLLDGNTDSSFVIKKINDGVQMVDSTSFTEWEFSVQPIKSGNNKLSLIVSIIKDGNTKQTVYTSNIKVVSNPVGWSERFWSSQYKWLLSTFIIPIFVYFWKKKNKKDEKK